METVSPACETYDATADAQGAAVPPAEPAAPATYSETAKAVQGTMKNRQNTVPQTVGRLVKQTGADTMLKNAGRDRSGMTRSSTLPGITKSPPVKGGPFVIG